MLQDNKQYHCNNCTTMPWTRLAILTQSRKPLVSRASPFTKKEGSGTAPLLELFCWNAINITRATYFYASLAHCACGERDKLTTHGLMYVHVQHAGQVCCARVVHAYVPRSCRSHKICIFMFPRISGEKNNSSNGAVPDPSFFVKGLARETRKPRGC